MADTTKILPICADRFSSSSHNLKFLSSKIKEVTGRRNSENPALERHHQSLVCASMRRKQHRRREFTIVNCHHSIATALGGEAVHRFLCDKISGHIGNSEGAIGRKAYLDGCVVRMMVFEIIPFCEKLELFGGYNKVHDADVATDLIKCDDVGFTKMDMKLDKVHIEDSSREVVYERDDANVVTGSEDDKVSNVISSIVKNVMTITNRVKKRKLSMFVTPPSSTPRRKTKSIIECKECHVISDEGDTSEEDEKIFTDKDELKLKNYSNREDFCGCEEVSDKERNIIMKYLTEEKLSDTVWKGERFKICGLEFCDLLFGNALKDNIINCYMQIVSEYSGKNGSEIFCMDTTVQDEVLGALQRLNKKRKLKDDGYHDFFLSNLTNDSREKLEQLNRKLMDRCRFLLFPIHAKYHWFLLVYRTEKREFELRNSIYTAMSLGTARAYATFLVGYMRIMFNYKTKEYVNQVFCRQQGVYLNCGVYTYLWANCYARDDDEAWTYERDCKINSVRERIAATILSDNNGVFSKDS